MSGRSIIRDMKEEDYDAVMRVWKEADLPRKCSGRDSREALLSELENGKSRLLVALIDGKLVGTLLVTHDGRKGWMNRLGVLRGYRGRGIASDMLDEGEKWLEECGIAIFACLIEGHNEGSMTFFEKKGYQEFKGVKYFTKRLHPDV
ncbi:MAG: GNAT family N-acetyltransferase [Thermoplasmatota archaeon]